MDSRERFYNWQEYQSYSLDKNFLDKKQASFYGSRFGWLLKIGIIVVVFLLVGYRVPFLDYFQSVKEKVNPKDSLIENRSVDFSQSIDALGLSQVNLLMNNISLLNKVESTFSTSLENRNFIVHTSLEPELQTFLTISLEKLKKLNRGKPLQIAMVAMNGQTGQIMAMAGFDSKDSKINPCVKAVYPAASVFKIITASAAMDSHGYTPHSSLYYNGNKYTLYKRQLVSIRNRYTVKMSLANAFAQSVNPIFGKLGKNLLGSQGLMEYAKGFGFNYTPESDFAFETGCFDTGKGGYYLAELGCGFNRDTLISPVFGAMIATCVLNDGKILIPTTVERVDNAEGDIVYRRTLNASFSAMAPKTSHALFSLMQKTVKSGTAKKAFRRFSRDRVLSKLDIGGKTGSIYNKSHTVKYDWFIGFGREKEGTRSLALAVVVGHGKYIGTRAAEHARRMLRKYFYQYVNDQ